MGEFYGKISVLSICSSNKYFSVIKGDGEAKSNDQHIARELSSKLPDLLDKSNYYVYDLERRK